MSQVGYSDIGLAFLLPNGIGAVLLDVEPVV